MFRLMQGWLFIDDGFWKPPQMKALLTSVPQVNTFSKSIELLSPLFDFVTTNRSHSVFYLDGQYLILNSSVCCIDNWF